MTTTIKHICWDWNGTLLDDVALVTQCVNHAISKYNIAAISVEYFRENFSFPSRIFYENLGMHLSDAEFHDLSLDFHELYDSKMTECKLCHNSLNCIKGIAALGISQSILSALPHELLLKHVAQHGLTAYFSKLSGGPNSFGAGKAARAKDHLQETGFQPEEVLFIGDTVHDLETARQAGVSNCILVAQGYCTIERLKAEHELVIEVLPEDARNLLSDIGIPKSEI